MLYVMSSDTPPDSGPSAPVAAAASDFEMSYRPEVSVFPPHWTERAPSILLVLIALGVGVVVVIGENSPATSALFRYVVSKDVERMMSMRMFAILLGIGAFASLMRSNMKGVRVYPDGLETREVHSLIMPRVRRYRWLQVECIILDMKRSIALDLWDGRRAFLPPVADQKQLRQTLERLATARAIPIRGGQGLDEVPERVTSSPPEDGA